MVKVIALVKRRSNMAPEEFQRYWRERHPDVVTRLPELRRYVQSRTLAGGYRRGEPIYDGIAEVWFDSTDALRALSGTPALAAVREDEMRFLDVAGQGPAVLPPADVGVDHVQRQVDVLLVSERALAPQPSVRAGHLPVVRGHDDGGPIHEAEGLELLEQGEDLEIDGPKAVQVEVVEPPPALRLHRHLPEEVVPGPLVLAVCLGAARRVERLAEARR